MSKMSRRVLAMLMAFAMTASMGISALAEGDDVASNTPDTSESQTVTSTDSADQTDVTEPTQTPETEQPNTTEPEVTEPETTVDNETPIPDEEQPAEESTEEPEEKLPPVNMLAELPGNPHDPKDPYYNTYSNGFFFVIPGYMDVGQELDGDKLRAPGQSTYVGFSPLLRAPEDAKLVLDNASSHKGYYIVGSTETEKYITEAPDPTQYKYPVINGATYDPTGKDANTYSIVWQRIGWRTAWGHVDQYVNDDDNLIKDNQKEGWILDGVVVLNSAIPAEFIVLHPDGTEDSTVRTYSRNTIESEIIPDANEIKAKYPQTKQYKNETYTLIGWYLDAACTVPANFNRGRIDKIQQEEEHITYYAKYTKDSKKLVYKYLNEAGAVAEKSYTIHNLEMEIPLPKGPDGGENSFFAGWYNHEYGYSVVKNRDIGGFNQSTSYYTKWVADENDPDTMTIYATYYQPKADEPQYIVTTDTGSKPFTNADPKGWVDEDLFGDVEVEELSNNKYLVYSQFMGGTTTNEPVEDADRYVDGYNEVGFVVSTNAADIAIAPTIQGGYQFAGNDQLYQSSVKVGGVSHFFVNTTNANPHAHHIAWRISVAGDQNFFVTPYAITKNGAYIYGAPTVCNRS